MEFLGCRAQCRASGLGYGAQARTSKVETVGTLG